MTAGRTADVCCGDGCCIHVYGGPRWARSAASPAESWRRSGLGGGRPDSRRVACTCPYRSVHRQTEPRRLSATDFTWSVCWPRRQPSLLTVPVLSCRSTPQRRRSMSVTTTQNPATYTIVRTLADYDLHHSEPVEGSPEGIAPPNPRSEPAAQTNPEHWPADYRRVPPIRPVDHTLDFNARNITLNNIETFFLFNMFGGIQIVQVGDSAARQGRGKLTDQGAESLVASNRRQV